ncbi:MAG: phospholipase, partial [Acidobacteriales bacterium]|nr:phospholipase [Terriglobales bacterium]
MRRILKFALISIATIYLLLCVALYLHQTKFIFIPQREVENTPRDFGCDFEDVQFPATDGKSQLHGWWLPNNSEAKAGIDPQRRAEHDADDDSESGAEPEPQRDPEKSDEKSDQDSEPKPAHKPFQKPRRLSGVTALVGPAGVAAAAGNRGLHINTVPGLAAEAAAQAGSSNRRALIYFHGNGGSIGANAAHACRLSRMGFAVLIFDYRGYGRSEGGPPTEKQVYDDAEQAWNFLLTKEPLSDPSPDKINAKPVIYGHSLGGAVAVEMATRHPEASALIVESSFTSIQEMAKQSPQFRFFPTWLILNQHMDSLEKMFTVKMPVLVIHGTADNIVPFAMSEKLYAAAPGKKQLFLVPGAGHENCASVAGEKYQEAVGK